MVELYVCRQRVNMIVLVEKCGGKSVGDIYQAWNGTDRAHVDVA